MTALTHLPDVSEWQAPLAVTDWQRLFNEQHRRYGTSGAAIVRIDYGDAHADRHLANRATFHQAGGKVLGLYQYDVDGQPVDLAAKAFIALVGKLRPGEFTVLDEEEGGGNRSPRVVAWFSHVDPALTYPGYHGGWLYSGESFYREHYLVDAHRRMWVAAYRTGPEPVLPHVLWQHTDGKLGDVGCQPWPVVGHVDCSIFHGTVDQLAATVWTAETGHWYTVCPGDDSATIARRGHMSLAKLEEVNKTVNWNAPLKIGQRLWIVPGAK